MAVTQSALVNDYVAKGSAITDSQAAKNRGALDGNRLRVKAGVVAIADGDFDADGDVIVLCPLHIDDVVHQIWIANDDLDSGSDSSVNLGLYVDAAGTDVESESAYASNVTTQFQAATAFTDLAFEARGIEKAGQAVWEDAGYSDRDAALAATEAFRGRLFLALTQTAAVTTDAAGDVSFFVVYSSDH